MPLFLQTLLILRTGTVRVALRLRYGRAAVGYVGAPITSRSPSTATMLFGLSSGAALARLLASSQSLSCSCSCDLPPHTTVVCPPLRVPGCPARARFSKSDRFEAGLRLKS